MNIEVLVTVVQHDGKGTRHTMDRQVAENFAPIVSAYPEVSYVDVEYGQGAYVLWHDGQPTISSADKADMITPLP